jgi:copper homeostasis protein
MKNFLFELCVESLEAAQAAESGGADRIELCSQLPIGGITPGLELINTATRALSIPVHVLIRPRSGNFVFSSSEFDQMRWQIEQVKKAGAAGIAVGILLPDGSVDMERSRELVGLGRPMSVTFHRAFDESGDLRQALENVVLAGADCLLTSGGAADVLAGAESIARLSRQAGNRLQIMAGGGLRLDNLVEVVRRTGVSYLHGSMTRRSVEGYLAGELEAETLVAVCGPSTLETDVRESVRLLRREFTQRKSPAQAAY